MRCICSSLTMAAHKNILTKLNLHNTHFITLVVVPQRGNEWRCPTPRLSARATHLRRNFAAVANRCLHVSDLTGLGIEPQTFRIDSDISSKCAITARFNRRIIKI